MNILMQREYHAIGLEWPSAEPYHEVPTIIPLEIILNHILPCYPRDWLLVSYKCQSVAFPLLLNDPRVDPTISKNGSDTPIVEASKNGFLRVVAQLARDPRIHSAKHIELAMEASVKHGHIHVFDFLYDQITREKQADQVYLRQLMEVAVEGGHYIMLEHLTTIPLARPLLQFDIANVVALAIREGDYHITKLLLQKCRRVPWYIDRDEVHNLIERNNHHMLKLLVEYNRLSTSRDPFERSPIHVAASKGYLECIKILLAVGYTPLEVYYYDEVTISTPIYEAKIHRQLEVLKFFMAHPSIGEEKQKIKQYLAEFSYV